MTERQQQLMTTYLDRAVKTLHKAGPIMCTNSFFSFLPSFNPISSFSRYNKSAVAHFLRLDEIIFEYFVSNKYDKT